MSIRSARSFTPPTKKSRGCRFHNRRSFWRLGPALADGIAAFLNDNRTMQALEAYTNRQWVARYRREAVATLAAHDWEALKAKPGLGMRKLRALVEMFAIAAADL